MGIETSSTETPATAGFQQPAEWAPHESTWLAWPSHEDLWLENLEPARREFVALCRGIAQGERLEICVPDETQEALARTALAGLDVRFHRIAFGDIWLRDTAPIFLLDADSRPAAARFAFNGWGGKYVLDHDPDVSSRIAEVAGLKTFSFPWILEGGSVEVDGEGTVLTTRQCLLNENRNPGASEAEVEAWLRGALGVSSVVWLDEGLLNDHTDGHIDTIARFVAPGVVLCMEAHDADDPNRGVLDAIAGSLARAVDARGRALEVLRVPSPGRVVDSHGRVMPASYVNFYIANSTVIVPTYGTRWDEAAISRIGALFPGRTTIGVSARAILEGGGAFHCITQQVPRAGTGVAR